jgi:hypothetical protein
LRQLAIDELKEPLDCERFLNNDAVVSRECARCLRASLNEVSGCRLVRTASVIPSLDSIDFYNWHAAELFGQRF